MTKHLQNDLTRLEQCILKQASMVEEMVDRAALALRELRGELVFDVYDREVMIDQEEIRIEEECLKVLALHQPVAVDLRRVTTVMKVNSELERIADLAVHIAKRAECLTNYLDFPVPHTLERMSRLATSMLRKSMNAFVDQDADAAREVCQSDDTVDAYNREMINHLRGIMKQRSEAVDPALHFFTASRQIERIADHATNIAEDVIYLVEGEITRHQEATQEFDHG